MSDKIKNTLWILLGIISLAAIGVSIFIIVNKLKPKPTVIVDEVGQITEEAGEDAPVEEEEASDPMDALPMPMITHGEVRAIRGAYEEAIDTDMKLQSVENASDGTARYTFTFEDTDIAFYVDYDEVNDSVIGCWVQNKYKKDWPIVFFTYGVPNNAKKIYKRLFMAGYTGQYVTNYDEGKSIKINGLLDYDSIDATIKLD